MQSAACLRPTGRHDGHGTDLPDGQELPEDEQQSPRQERYERRETGHNPDAILRCRRGAKFTLRGAWEPSMESRET